MPNMKWEISLGKAKAKEFAVLLKQRPWIGRTTVLLEEDRIVLVQSNRNCMVQHTIETELFTEYECNQELKIELDIAQLVVLLDTVTEDETTVISITPPTQELLVVITAEGGGVSKCSMPFEFLPVTVEFGMPSSADYDVVGVIDNFPKFTQRLALFDENVDILCKSGKIIAITRNGTRVCISEIRTTTASPTADIPVQRFQLHYLRNFMRSYKETETPPIVSIHASAEKPLYMKYGSLACLVAKEAAPAGSWILP